MQQEDIKKNATEDQELDVKDPELSSEEMAFLSVLKSSAMPLDESLLAAHFPHGNIDWVSGLGLLASNLEDTESPMGGIEEETKGSLWSGWLADSCDLCVYSEVFNLSPATRYLSCFFSFFYLSPLCCIFLIFKWTFKFPTLIVERNPYTSITFSKTACTCTNRHLTPIFCVGTALNLN